MFAKNETCTDYNNMIKTEVISLEYILNKIIIAMQRLMVKYSNFLAYSKKTWGFQNGTRYWIDKKEINVHYYTLRWILFAVHY